MNIYPPQNQMGYQPNFQQGNMQQPTVIVVNNTSNNNNDTAYCQYCKGKTEYLTRRKVGRVAIIYGIVLGVSGGLFCGLCLIPCCNEDCKDLEIVCTTCQQVSQVIPATFC